MSTTDQNISVTFTVDQSADEVFAAINNVRDWWSGTIVGDTDRLGAEWVYVVADMHFSKFRITELEPGRRVAWEVVDSYLSLPPDFVVSGDKEEWTGTTVVFDITVADGQTKVRFTHEGITPEVDCYAACEPAWNQYIGESLRNLIASGQGAANSFEGEAALDTIREQASGV